MSLVLLIANNDHIIQVSDRRITYPASIDENFNKSILCVSNYSRFTLGMIGLAKNIDNSINIQKLILDIMYELGNIDSITEFFDRFKLELNKLFTKNKIINKLTNKQKQLSILCSGFLKESSGSYMFSVILTNCQDMINDTIYKETKDDFEMYNSIENKYKHDLAIVEKIGYSNAINKNDEKKLVIALRNKNEQEILDTAIGVFYSIANRTKSNN